MSSSREIAVTLEQRITATEAELFAELGIEVRTSFLALSRTGLRVRVLEHGSGPPLMLLHGVSLGAAAWAPLFAPLAGYRVIAVEAPGHGLSDPFAYERGKGAPTRGICSTTSSTNSTYPRHRWSGTRSARCLPYGMLPAGTGGSPRSRLVAPVATAALIRSHLQSTERSRLIVTRSA